MKKYALEFLKRGLIFAGLGPVILGIVYWLLSDTVKGFTLGGGEACLAIVSIYLLAFLQAGASVFNQIEEWSLGRSLLCHFGTLYIAYVGCYLLNTWIPFEPMVLMIFTAVFVAVYFAIWITVYLCVKATGKKLNQKLK